MKKDNNMELKHDYAAISSLLEADDRATATGVRRVVIWACIINALIMAVKIVAGNLGHADVLVADGFHSLGDFATDLIMLFFISFAVRGATRRYPYGRGKFETLATLGVSLLIFFIGVSIIIEAAEKIEAVSNGAVLDQPAIWTVWVVLLAMVAKEGVYRIYSAAGRRFNSQALRAIGWHHRVDAMASLVTVAGICLSYFFGESMRIFDPIMSIAIAGLILTAAVNLIRPALSELTDTSLPQSVVEQLREAALSAPGVEGVKAIRTRRNGRNVFVELEAEVAPDMTASEVASLKQSLLTDFSRIAHSPLTLTLDIA